MIAFDSPAQLASLLGLSSTSHFPYHGTEIYCEKRVKQPSRHFLLRVCYVTGTTAAPAATQSGYAAHCATMQAMITMGGAGRQGAGQSQIDDECRYRK